MPDTGTDAIAQFSRTLFIRRAVHPVTRHWPYALVVLINVTIYHAWLRAGLLVGGDFLPRSAQELQSFFPWPHLWNGSLQLGSNEQVFSFAFPLYAVMGALAHLNASWRLIERIIYFWPYLLLVPLGPYALAHRLTNSRFAALIAALFFSVNTWTIFLNERGHTPSVIATAFMCLVLLQLLRFLDDPSPRAGLVLSSLMMGVLVYDLRYVYIAALTCTALCIERLIRDRSFRFLRVAGPGFITVAGSFLIFNLYWLLPELRYPATQGSGYGTSADFQSISSFVSLSDSLAAFKTFYHWVASNPPFETHPAEPPFFLLPFFAFVSLAGCWKRVYVKSFAVLGVIAIVVVSGSTFPFASLNLWLFSHVPGMSLFRDTSKWMSLSTLCYALAFAYGTKRATAYLRMRISKSYVTVCTLALASTVAVYMFLMGDAYNPIRYRLYAAYNRTQDTEALETFIRSDHKFSRTLFFPYETESLRGDEMHPYMEAAPLANGNYPEGLSALKSEQTPLYSFYASPLAPNILRALNIKYVVVPYDYDHIIYSGNAGKLEFFDAVHFLQTRIWLHLVRRIGKHYVFALVNSGAERAFVSPLPFVYAASGNSLIALAGTPWWSRHVGAISISQNVEPSILNSYPNYITGPVLVDSKLSDDAQIGVLSERIGRFNTVAARSRVFRGEITSTAVTTDTGGSASGAGFFNNTFSVLRAGMLHVDGALSYLPPSRQLAPNPKGIVVSRQATAPTGNPLFAFNGALHPGDPTSLPQIYLHGRTATLALFSDNAVPLTGTLRFPGLHVNLPYARLQFRLNGARKVVILTRFATTNLLWEGVHVKPGRNQLTVSALDVDKKTTLDFNGQIGLFDETPQPTASFRYAIVTKKVANDVIRFGLRPSQRGNEIVLLPNISVPLTNFPIMSVEYHPLQDTAIVPQLVFTLRSGEGNQREYVTSLDPQVSTYTASLRDAINNALDTEFERTVANHRSDFQWLRQHRLADQPDGASAFTITKVALAFQNGSEARRNSFAHFDLLSAAMTSSPQAVSLGGQEHNSKNVANLDTHSMTPDLRGFVLARVAASGNVAFASLSPAPVIFIQDRRAAFQFHVPSAAPNAMLDFAVNVPTGYELALSFSDGTGATTFRDIAQPNQLALQTPGGWYEIAAGRAPVSLNDVACAPSSCPPNVQSGVWKHYRISLRSAKLMSGLHNLPNRLTLTFLAAPPSADLYPSFWIIGGTTALTPKNLGMLVHIDGKMLNHVMLSHLTKTEASFHGSIVLGGRPYHQIASAPTFPWRVLTALLHQGRKKAFKLAVMQHPQLLNAAEITGTIQDDGGLLVFSEAYDPGWRAAILPSSVHPSGVPLVDYFRLRNYFLPKADHLIVDEVLNGWTVPPGSYRVAFFFSPEVTAQIGILLSIMFGFACIVFVFIGTRTAR
ncbi:MAG: hypothetical protein M3Z14_04705 [Candidatus Eremiobacteraeota bacterium]|nr:hypothetical protein [Candidatus Eremiobacteraeota bacterium]